MANKKVKGYISLGGSFAISKCANYNTHNEPFSFINENEPVMKTYAIKEKEFYKELKALEETIKRVKTIEQATFALELYADTWLNAKKYNTFLAKNNAFDREFIKSFTNILDTMPVKKTKYSNIYPLGF